MGDFKVPVPCSKCGHKTEELLSRLERDLKIACPKCNTVIHFTRDNLVKLRKSHDDLTDFGGPFNFKIG